MPKFRLSEKSLTVSSYVLSFSLVLLFKVAYLLGTTRVPVEKLQLSPEISFGDYKMFLSFPVNLRLQILAKVQVNAKRQANGLCLPPVYGICSRRMKLGVLAHCSFHSREAEAGAFGVGGWLECY